MHSYEYYNKIWPVISKYSANLLVFVMESLCVLNEVRTGSLYVLQINFRLKKGQI